jgi:probable O-glycosylation ligase (exosortase A-associated)
MKQFAFMALTLLLGTAGSFVLSPVYGVAVYYMYAVLRPQFIWDWVELSGLRLGDVNWSFPVAVATLAATVLWRLGLWTPFAAAKAPWHGNPRFGRSHYLFLAFTAWISLTYLVTLSGLAREVPGFTMSERERVSRPYFIEYAKIFVMFVCASLVLRSVRDLWVIYYVVVACVAYIGYELNFYYLVYRSNTLYTRGYGGLDNNGAALILAMGVPLCFFAWEANRRWWRWAFLAVAPVLLHAVMLSHSRGAMLSLCVAAVLVWVRARNKKFVTVLYGLAVVLVLVMAGKEVRERFFSIGEREADASWNSRKTTWGIAVRMATEEPLFGYGIRNSNLFIDRYGADVKGRTIHSQYLQTAADSGWAALGLYLALLASVFAGLWQVRRAVRPFADPDSLKVRSLASGLECALVVFCVGAAALSLEHFEMPYIVLLLAVQLHAITRAISERLNPPQPGLPPLTLPHPYPAGTPRPAVSP